MRTLMPETGHTPGMRTTLRRMEPDKIAAAAEDILERQKQQRLAVIERLAAGQRKEDELLAELAGVQQSYGRDWAEAERLGWSPRDLRRLGLRPPRRTRSPRAGRNVTSSGTSTHSKADDGTTERRAANVASPSPSPLAGEQSPVQPSAPVEPASDF